MKQYNCIIIGSGIAGLNFALNVARSNLNVLVITKKKAVHSSTNKAQGGIAAVIDKADNFKKHVKDTLVAGSHHNNKKAVEFMVKNGPDAIKKLIEYGVNFASLNGELQLTQEGGHSDRRIAYVGDYTGKEIEEALIRNVEENKYIEVREDTVAIDLLVEDGACVGISAIENQKVIHIYAESVVIATGGVGQLYEKTTNPEISTGDGIAMAKRAGLKLKDLEFIQFHPTALDVKNGNSFLLSEALRGEGALLLNEKGERFMKHIHTSAELAPRDVVARAIYNERTKGKVYLSLKGHDKNELMLRFPSIYKTLKAHKLDLSKDLIPISPAAHYICGGIKVNQKGQTSLKNVYAYGEVSATGVHGANRLASNSLLEALVYSNQVAKEVKAHGQKTYKAKKLMPTLTYAKATKKQLKYIDEIKNVLKKTMWQHVGIVRTGKGLLAAEKIMDALTQDLENNFNKETINEELLEIKNMLCAATAIIAQAKKRKKSLGTHYIIDK